MAQIIILPNTVANFHFSSALSEQLNPDLLQYIVHICLNSLLQNSGGILSWPGGLECSQFAISPLFSCCCFSINVHKMTPKWHTPLDKINNGSAFSWMVFYVIKKKLAEEETNNCTWKARTGHYRATVVSARADLVWSCFWYWGRQHFIWFICRVNQWSYPFVFSLLNTNNCTGLPNKICLFLSFSFWLSIKQKKRQT